MKDVLSLDFAVKILDGWVGWMTMTKKSNPKTQQRAETKKQYLAYLLKFQSSPLQDRTSKSPSKMLLPGLVNWFVGWLVFVDSPFRYYLFRYYLLPWRCNAMRYNMI